MTEEEIDKIAESLFGHNSSTESYRGWVNGFTYAQKEIEALKAEMDNLQRAHKHRFEVLEIEQQMHKETREQLAHYKSLCELGEKVIKRYRNGQLVTEEFIDYYDNLKKKQI